MEEKVIKKITPMTVVILLVIIYIIN